MQDLSVVINNTQWQNICFELFNWLAVSSLATLNMHHRHPARSLVTQDSSWTHDRRSPGCSTSWSEFSKGGLEHQPTSIKNWMNVSLYQTRCSNILQDKISDRITWIIKLFPPFFPTKCSWPRQQPSKPWGWATAESNTANTGLHQECLILTVFLPVLIRSGFQVLILYIPFICHRLR